MRKNKTVGYWLNFICLQLTWIEPGEGPIVQCDVMTLYDFQALGTDVFQGFLFIKGETEMKWSKLIQRTYKAIIKGDVEKEAKLWHRALKKNMKAHAKGKKRKPGDTVIR